MKAVIFTVNLLEPLLATGLEGDPNSGVSQNYIAGSVLRGAIISLYLRAAHQSELDLTDDENKLFFNGSVCYLNSYPLAKVSVRSVRSLPTPLVWQKEKDEVGQSFKNFSVKERDAKSYKNIGTPFFAFETDDACSISNEIIAVNPKRLLAVHIDRSITGNTGGENDSQVFRYQSIAKDTQFGGAIISECKTCLETIKALIENKQINLGGSRTAGYGKAEFQNAEIIEDWKEPQVSHKTAINSGDIFSVTLLSNALVRDKNGQLQADLTADLLGVDARPCGEKTFKRAELVGGFNRKWGLPLPQQLSINAGSVFSFTANEDISPAKIQELHSTGIGERNLDGFGRIAINLNNEDESLEWKEFIEAPIDKTLQSAFSDKMIKRILQQKLDFQLPGLINANKISGKISNSQISRLRLSIREILRPLTISKETAEQKKETVKQKIADFLAQLRPTALNQFQSAKVGNANLDEWMKSQIEYLNSFGTEKKVILGGQTQSSKDLLVEYHLYLIDGILKQAAKESK